MPVLLGNRQTIPLAGARVRRVAERALRALGASGAELSIALVDDAQMRALNRRYRRQDRTTDVLAFDGQPPRWLGDVVISVETAQRRVGPAPGRLQAEVARYLLHGLLHLMGWEHDTAPARRRMRRREQALWRQAWGHEPSGGRSATRSGG